MRPLTHSFPWRGTLGHYLVAQIHLERIITYSDINGDGSGNIADFILPDPKFVHAVYFTHICRCDNPTSSNNHSGLEGLACESLYAVG